MLSRLGDWASEAARHEPWSNVYGLARTILALGTALSLAVNPWSNFFRPAAGVMDFPVCDGPRLISIFCVLRSRLDLARLLAVAILLVVASGWRPRFTAIPHFWISYSFMSTAIGIDGGDQITSILTLLLLPIALTDRRRWHWSASRSASDATDIYRRLVALSAFVVIRVQVAVVYFHAAVGKFAVAEWQDGTALYYWMTDPTVGVAPSILPLVRAITSRPVPVVVMTWGAILTELTIFMALVMPAFARKYVLLLGIAFHAAIGLAFGLISFSMAMIAALILYLRKPHQAFAARSMARTAPDPAQAVSPSG